MINLTRTYTRPNTSVDWHTELLDFSPYQDHLRLTYIDTGKLLSRENTVSNDGLTRTFIMSWNDLQSFQTYDADPHFDNFWKLRDEYNASVGIVTGEKIIIEI